MYSWHTNVTPFHTRNLGICGFWNSRGVCTGTTPPPYKGAAVYKNLLREILKLLKLTGDIQILILLFFSTFMFDYFHKLEGRQ